MVKFSKEKGKKPSKIRDICYASHIDRCIYQYNNYILNAKYNERISKDGSISCHATSFIRVVDGKIASIDEYWGDDGPAPQWRQDKHIGTKIKE